MKIYQVRNFDAAMYVMPGTRAGDVYAWEFVVGLDNAKARAWAVAAATGQTPEIHDVEIGADGLILSASDEPIDWQTGPRPMPLPIHRGVLGMGRDDLCGRPDEIRRVLKSASVGESIWVWGRHKASGRRAVWRVVTSGSGDRYYSDDRGATSEKSWEGSWDLLAIALPPCEEDDDEGQA